MEQALIEKVINLLPKLQDKASLYNEKEMVVIKAAFEDITGIMIPVGGMTNCGGKVCEDFRRSIANYMAYYKHVNMEAPKKTKVIKEIVKDGADKIKAIQEKSKTGKEDLRNNLMADALKIAEEKEIQKPHHRAGEKTLIKYIKDNG